MDPDTADRQPDRTASSVEGLANDPLRELPWGRLGTIEDLGKAAAFLSSNAADYITAATLRVDGGFWVK